MKIITLFITKFIIFHILFCIYQYTYEIVHVKSADYKPQGLKR